MNTERRVRESVTESKGAGWKWIPQQRVHLWWDGERYTWRADWDGSEWHVEPVTKPTRRDPPPPAQAAAEAKPQIPASRAVRIWMKVLIVAFWAGLVWFAMQTENKQCFPEGPATLTYTDVSNAVGPWLLLVGLASVGVCTWLWFAEEVAWVKKVAIAGVVVTVVTCPVLVACAGAMNCGL
jgi:hypothetical protein